MKSRISILAVAVAITLIPLFARLPRLRASEMESNPSTNATATIGSQLVHRRGSFDVPVNTGVEWVQFWGRRDKQVVGTLKIEASGNIPNNDSRTPYDWSVHLTVPRGGLVEFTNQFDFVAPDSGYRQSVEIHMDKDQPGWSDSMNKSYFVKLRNGYLRMNIQMKARTPFFTSLEFFYNPDGSRNLAP